jgi:hypothetical protein
MFLTTESPYLAPRLLETSVRLTIHHHLLQTAEPQIIT